MKKTLDQVYFQNYLTIVQYQITAFGCLTKKAAMTFKSNRSEGFHLFLTQSMAQDVDVNDVPRTSSSSRHSRRIECLMSQSSKRACKSNSILFPCSLDSSIQRSTSIPTSIPTLTTLKIPHASPLLASRARLLTTWLRSSTLRASILHPHPGIKRLYISTLLNSIETRQSRGMTLLLHRPLPGAASAISLTA